MWWTKTIFFFSTIIASECAPTLAEMRHQTDQDCFYPHWDWLNFGSCPCDYSGLVWSGPVGSGRVWSVPVWTGPFRSALVWSDRPYSVWSGLVWSGLIWSGLLRYICIFTVFKAFSFFVLISLVRSIHLPFLLCEQNSKEKCAVILLILNLKCSCVFADV
jgi:hypothetical protein